MSSMIAEAFVRLRSDDSVYKADVRRQVNKATSDVARTNREFARFSRGTIVGTGALGGLGRAAAFASLSFIGGAGLVAGLKASVSAASNLAEQQSKTGVVFGQSAAQVEEWSKTSSTALGLARDQALETASSFGALLKPLGVSGEAAASQSKKLTQLGADLASFYNTSVADALAAIKSGLVGEVEPLRRYGVVLSETRVQQEALVETGKKQASQLTAQEKVLARQALIYRDTTQAQGDFARTSGGLANQQRILAANLRNFEILAGQAVIPALIKIITRTNKWLENTKNQEKFQRDVNTTVNFTTGVLGFLAARLEDVNSTYQKIQDLDPFGGKSLDDLIHFTGLIGFVNNSLPTQLRFLHQTSAAMKDLAASQALVAQGYANIEAARAAAGDVTTAPRVANKLPLVSGSSFVGRPLTPAEQLAIDLAANPDNTALLLQQRAAKQRALDFALKQIKNEKGNTKRFAEAAKNLSGDIASINSQLAGIAASNASAAEQRRNAAKAAQEAAFQESLGRLDLRITQAEETKGFEDDLRFERAKLAFLLQQTRTAENSLQLDQLLTETRKQISDTLKEQRKVATEQRVQQAQAARDEDEFALTRAQSAGNLAKQITADRQIEQDILDQIKISGRTLQLRKDLFNVRQDIASLEAQQEEKKLGKFDTAVTLADLRLQIAEQTVAKEQQLLPFLRNEITALNKQLAALKKSGATKEEQLGVLLKIAQTNKRINEIVKGGAGGFTLSEFFAEAAREQQLYGSNIGGADVPLSGQAGRGMLGAIASAPASAAKAALAGAQIVQNFFGEMPNPAQALQQASQAARALR